MNTPPLIVAPSGTGRLEYFRDRGLRAILLISVILLTLNVSSRTIAAEQPWPQASYAYYAPGESIQGTLRNFADNFGIRANLDHRLIGQIEGRFLSATPTEFLDKLAATYGFNWFSYEGILYASPNSANTQRVIKVGRADSLKLKAALQGLGIFQEKFGWGEFPDRGVIIISGPVAYVDLVARTVSNLPIDPPTSFSMAVFKLKNAFADDRSYTYRDTQVRVPGVASILQSLINGNGTVGTQVIAMPSNNRGVTDINIDRPSNPGGIPLQSGVQIPSSVPNATIVNAASPEQQGELQATIQADVRLNAVIIKDRPENIATYRDLIEQLDVAASLIEIEATIIDVNAGDMDRLGIGWPSEVNLSFPSRPKFTTLINNAVNPFWLSLQALSRTSKAKVLARPSILTIDNLQALIDLSRTLNIRVQGERVAQLVKVSTGTVMRITPHLIKRPNESNDIQLTVDITDGTFSPDAGNGEVPAIDENNINTQAIVGNNQSLLIGGYTRTQETNSEKGVPLLSDIPLLGNLFKTTETTNDSRQRIYLITPRVVRLQ